MFPTSPEKKKQEEKHKTHIINKHTLSAHHTTEEAKLLVVMHNINNHFYFTQFILETPSSKNIKFYIYEIQNSKIFILKDRCVYRYRINCVWQMIYLKFKSGNVDECSSYGTNFVVFFILF